MKKLVEIVKEGNLTVEEKGNMVLSLIKLADAGKKFPGAIDDYLVDDKSNVCFMSNDGNDVTLSSPEFFIGKEADLRDKSLFSVGLLAYYIYNGKSYYDVKGITPLDVFDLIENGSESLIGGDELMGAYAGFTSWRADKRYEGAEAFLKYTKTNFKATYVVNYKCDGSIVKIDGGELVGDIEKYPATNTIEASDGAKYKINKKCKIPYRVGNTVYTVNVTRVEVPAPSNLPNRVSRDQDGATTTTSESASTGLPIRAEDVDNSPKIVNRKVQPVIVNMNLPREVRNLAIIKFVCDGRVVYETKRKNISSTIAEHPFGRWIATADGEEYIALATADILNIDGAYQYTIPVIKAKGKINTCIMLECGDCRFQRLVTIGVRESKSFTCYVDGNGFNVPLVGGYVDSGSGEVIFRGPIGLTPPHLATLKKARVTVNSYSDGDYITVDAVEIDSGAVYFKDKRIDMPTRII